MTLRMNRIQSDLALTCLLGTIFIHLSSFHRSPLDPEEVSTYTPFFYLCFIGSVCSTYSNYSLLHFSSFPDDLQLNLTASRALGRICAGPSPAIETKGEKRPTPPSSRRSRMGMVGLVILAANDGKKHGKDMGKIQRSGKVVLFVLEEIL